jgi:alpha(1,3/1,4) fucosyltransferase
MKKTIKIYFVDFWNGFIPEDNFFIKRLQLYYNVIIDSKPDYLFYSHNGNKNLKFNSCIKIYFSGENDVPDFNLCDYAIAFHHITFEDRYFRLPLYTLYKCFEEISNTGFDLKNVSTLLNRKFCNFVVSNSKGADPIREEFFRKLSEYKKVDSGGRYLNNIGRPVTDKLEFIREYKFTIAIENSSASGYTTEKLVEPMAANSIPIYWGDPNVQLDFNKKSFICLKDFESIDQAIEEIIYLDTHDEAYIKMLSEPHYCLDQKKYQDWMGEYDTFMRHIFDLPIETAKRRTGFGYAKYYQQNKLIISKICSLPGLKKIIRKLSYR